MTAPLPSIVLCTGQPAPGLREAIARINNPRMRLHIGTPGDLTTADAVYVSAMSGLDHGVELSYTRATVIPVPDPESNSPRAVVVGIASPLEGEIDHREAITRQIIAVLRAVGDHNATAEHPVRELALDLDWLVGTGTEARKLVIDVVSTASKFLQES